MFAHLTQEKRAKIKSTIGVGMTLLFVAGITMAIIGGTSGMSLLFGIGLGIACVMTVGAIGIREHNLAN